MRSNILICPVCRQVLKPIGSSYVCDQRHCFDIARKGYVNLLLKGGEHGDDRSMLTARRDFLSAGYYLPFAQELCRAVSKHRHNTVLDMGCGEGYYSSQMAELQDARVYAFDISKYAAAMTASRNKRLTVFTASSFSIPVADESIDVAVSVFAPFDAKEVGRILNKNGILVVAYPLKDHLLELKQAVYDEVLLNPDIVPSAEGLVLDEITNVIYTVKINNNNHVKALFSMTPYVYRTHKEHTERLDKLESLNCSVEIGVAVYKKI